MNDVTFFVHMEVEPKHLSKKLWGEPVTRPDGVMITIQILGNNEFMTLVASSMAVIYSKRELELLGDGNFDKGVARVGQAHYSADRRDLIGSKPKALYSEIKELEKLYEEGK